LIAVANSVALIVAVAVPLGVKIRGDSNEPDPDQVPPVEEAVPTVILTCPAQKKGITAVEFVKAALGKSVFENEDAEIPNNKINTNKYLKEFLNFCKVLPLRFLIKKSLLKTTL
jgi:hypothetical protein